MKSTVFGTVEVTFNVPAVTVNVPATPRYEPEPSCSVVPFTVTSKRLTVPESVEVPLNVMVPAEALSEPVTEIFEPIEKVLDVESEPVIFNAENDSVPAPEIVFAVPLNFNVPEPAVKFPATGKFPVISNVDEVETEPELMVKLLRMIPLPLSVVPLPLMVNVPLPAVWVNVPDPLVEKFPLNEIFVDEAALTPEPVTVR